MKLSSGVPSFSEGQSTALRIPGYGWAHYGSAAVEEPVEQPRIPLGTDEEVEKGLTLAKLNESPNVILLYRLETLRTMSAGNFYLAVLALTYFGVNVVMMLFNFLDKNDEDCGDVDDIHIARCGSPVSDYVFHVLEFTATFVFSLVQAIALLYTPKTQLMIYDRPLALKVVLFFAIAISFIPMLLITCNLALFEVLAHEIEYGNEITMSFVDLVFLASLVRQSSTVASTKGAKVLMRRFGPSAVATAVAVVQLAVYNGMGDKPDGGKKGETLAHYLEFSFEIISAAITFWFTVDNKVVADKEIDEIMYGDHRDCAVCHTRSVEMTKTRTNRYVSTDGCAERAQG